MAAPSPDIPTVESLTLLWLDDDSEYRSFVSDALESVPDVEVVVAEDAATALDHLRHVDGVVTDIGVADGDAADSGVASGEAADGDTANVGTFLASVRTRDRRVPIVVHTERPLADLGETNYAANDVDYLRKDWEASTVRLLVRRIRQLVERNRFSDLIHRLTGAVDACRDPVVVVGPDDAIEYTNGQFASALSPSRTDLCGQHWTELFTQDSVQQLQHEAIPIGTDGWSWNGTAELVAGEDEVSARVTLVRIDDGSKVFTFRDLVQPA